MHNPISDALDFLKSCAADGLDYEYSHMMACWFFDVSGEALHYAYDLDKACGN